MPKEKLSSPVITFTSDFGDKYAQAQVELVVYSINPNAKFIVVSNEITPLSILEGAFLLSKSYKYSPRNSIHLAVVDPGVGSERKGLLIKTQNHWFVGPDNGLLYPAAQDDVIKEVFALDEQKLNLSGYNTFHGRDVFAPTAARISLGESPLSFAQPIDPALICQYDIEPNRVAHVDRFGNIKLTSLPAHLQIGSQIDIDSATGSIRVPYLKTFTDVPEGELVAYQGSHGTLELGRNSGSAAQVLQFSVGQRVGINILQS